MIGSSEPGSTSSGSPTRPKTPDQSQTRGFCLRSHPYALEDRSGPVRNPGAGRDGARWGRSPSEVDVGGDWGFAYPSPGSDFCMFLTR
jgi:hypothetical protein